MALNPKQPESCVAVADPGSFGRTAAWPIPSNDLAPCMYVTMRGVGVATLLDAMVAGEAAAAHDRESSSRAWAEMICSHRDLSRACGAVR